MKGQPRAYVQGHRPSSTVPLGARLWARVDERGRDECWSWIGATVTGYGVIGLGRREHGNVMAHRAVYADVVGTIPAGYQVDHTCHNADPTCVAGDGCQHRRCVNPRHLEAVPQRTNLQRQGAAYRARRDHAHRGDAR